MRPHSSSLSRSRPKKTALSFSVNECSPGYGLRSSTSRSAAAPEGAARTVSSATATSRPDAYRSSRAFSRHRRTIPPTAGATPRVNDSRSAGVSSTIAVSVPANVSFRNGCFLASSSYSTTPNENTSDRTSTG